MHVFMTKGCEVVQDKVLFEAVGGASYNELLSRLIASLGEDASPVQPPSRAASSPYSAADTASTPSTATPLPSKGGPSPSLSLPPTAEVISCWSQSSGPSTSCSHHLHITDYRIKLITRAFTRAKLLYKKALCRICELFAWLAATLLDIVCSFV